MITKLHLKNFKSVDEQIYDFTTFDLIVGRNNSGKSTVLQAIAIWQYCITEFRQSKHTGSKGIQVVLPNFTALPVPEFNLIWKDRTDRRYPKGGGKRKQEFIYISIKLEWQHSNGSIKSFEVLLRYHSPQTIYAIPTIGWSKFYNLDKEGEIPTIAYVPPFSGLEPFEKWLDGSPIRQQIGKGQPGSILRNLLLRIVQNDLSDGKDNWNELKNFILRWFNVEIHKPEYNKEKDVNINVEYCQNNKNYDIISGGSGFHQVLTLLSGAN